MLDDGPDLAVLGNDATVARGVGRGHREDGADTVIGARCVDQGRDGLWAHERQVAVEHDHRTGEASEGVFDHADGMSRAQAFRLLHELDVPLARKAGAHLVRAVPDDDDDALDAGPSGGVNDPPRERTVQDLVRDLGMAGLHARSLAGGEDDRGDGHVASNGLACIHGKVRTYQKRRQKAGYGTGPHPTHQMRWLG